MSLRSTRNRITNNRSRAQRRTTIIRMEKGTYLFLLITIFFICVSQAFYVSAKDILPEAHALMDDNEPWQISADSLGYSEKEGLYTAEGNVLLTKGELLLSTRRALYNRNTAVVEALGNILFETGEDTLTGESGVFNLNDQTGQITKGLLFLKENHYYISGDVMEKTGEDSYLVRDFRLTTCDGPDPTWSITGSEVMVTIEGYGKVKKAAFRVNDIPFFYVPYMIFPAKTERQSGFLLPGLGYSNRNGMELEIPYFWAISEQTDATLYERFMSQRGLMQGFEFRYVSKDNSEGTYLLDILPDRIEKKELNNPEHSDLSPFERTNGTRYWLRSRTEQQLPGGIRARLDTDIVSDQDYLKEFGDGPFGLESRPDLAEESGRPVEEDNSPVRRSALRLTRDNEDYSLQALASYYQRPEGYVNDTTPQPMTGLNFSILPRTFYNLPMAFSLNTDYDYIWRDFGQTGHSISVTPEITYPTWVGPYLEFEPSVSFTRNMQWLDNNLDNINSQSSNAYRFQARLSTILEKIFDVDWKQAISLRHKLFPSFSYEYRGYKDENRYQPWFEPIDADGKINRITLSIDNFLDVKKKDNKDNITYARWGSLNLSQGFDLDEARSDEEPWRKKEPFEPLMGTLTLMPFPALDLDAEALWDHYKNEISFADLSIEFDFERSGGRKDIYEIDYAYLDKGNKGLGYYLNVNLISGFSFGNSLKRDMDLGHNIEKNYWIEYLAQCWGARLTVEKIDEESNIMLTFHLLGLGD
ncbi:LPS assembly protein LptD [Deltaproteobacteria bacterium]|nr:LPS assembly protein LptD [Deltaproteobacteria bacterium]